MNAVHEEPSFAVLLQEYFCKRLIAQRQSSPETVAGYRDAFRIFLKYIHETLRKEPTKITLDDLDAPLVLGFLDYLEHDRGNCARTRNIRFAAIRSFLRFVSAKFPATLPSTQRVLAIPMKRFDRPALGHLTKEEVNAILEAPDKSTWSGRRDHVMLTTLYNTGARVPEIRGVLASDAFTDKRRCIQIRGKGRKERVIPIWPSTCRLLEKWICESHFRYESPIFPNRNGEKISKR
jgi:integrase/recombinase XerD